MRIIDHLVASWLLALSAAAQDDGGKSALVRCTKCSNVGSTPCGLHPKKDCELEGNVLYCSIIGNCAICGGTGHVDCAKCTNEPVEARLAVKRARVPALDETHAQYSKEFGRSLRSAESAHFFVILEVEEMKVGRTRLDGHQLLHLYVDRLERLFADYTALLGVGEGEFEEKTRVMAWSFGADHRKAARLYCDLDSEGGVKLLGLHPTYTVPVTQQLLKDDEFMHRNVIHNAAHLLMSHQKPSYWVGNIKGGWADEGVAHWFEDKYFNRCDNYCYQEVNTEQRFKAGAWKPEVKKLVALGEAPGLADVFQQNTDTLSPVQHAVAFSVFDYLAAQDASKLNTLLVSLRSKTPTRDALKEAFGLSIIELEGAWRAWVLETYPAR